MHYNLLGSLLDMLFEQFIKCRLLFVHLFSLVFNCLLELTNLHLEKSIFGNQLLLVVLLSNHKGEFVLYLMINRKSIEI